MKDNREEGFMIVVGSINGEEVATMFAKGNEGVWFYDFVVVVATSKVMMASQSLFSWERTSST
jgi:hypothetical protein